MAPLHFTMRPALAVMTALILAAADPAAAAPPNDNYLASTTINRPDGTLPLAYGDQQNTFTATTQQDLFDFDKMGAPLGGGPPEPTTCGATSYGRTVWYDFVSPSAGGVKIVAAGMNAVIHVFEWNPSTSQITRSVLCQNSSSGTTEEVQMQDQIRRRTSYTVQVGSVNATGGLLDLNFTFFPDTDGDGVLDEAPDRCPSVPGIASSSGCPPLLRATPRIAFDNASGGIRIRSLVIDHVAKGARVTVGCGRCDRKVSRTAAGAGSLRLAGFVGRQVATGDTIELRVTQPRARSGRFRFGAVGRLFRWRVVSGRLGARKDSCLAPGSVRKKAGCP